MRLAIHAQALADIFEGRCDAFTANVVLGARIAITGQLLTQYQQLLSANQSFLDWFTSTNSAGRFSIHFPQQAPAQVQAADPTTDGYASPAYFAGGHLAAESMHLPAQAIPALTANGVDVVPVRSRFTGAVFGDNPFFACTLKAGGHQEFSSLNRFFLPEARVVVYDKYINATSLELLAHCAGLLSPGSQMEVFHAEKHQPHLLNSAAIEAGLRAANPNINVVCKQASKAFLQLAHDRYIFLGDRIQIVFSAGLDSFGSKDASTGRRNNRQSTISFYAICGGEPLAIEASDGTICRVQHIAEM